MSVKARKARLQGDSLDKKVGGGRTGPELTQAAEGPEQGCALIRKLTVVKGYGLEATSQNDERDTGVWL